MLLTILGASLIGSVFALIGGVFLLWREKQARQFSLALVSFAAGSLIGAAFLELIPEALHGASYDAIAPMIIVGVMLVFLFERFFFEYHCHSHGECDKHSVPSAVLFGDALHNFIDGVVIALSFSVSVPAGIATTVAVFFHEVPQEIGDFGILLHAGYEKKKVFWYNLWTALTTPLGALIGYLLLPWISPFLPYMLALAAGVFIYIAISDLLPELKHEDRGVEILHLASIGLGILLIAVIGSLFHE